MLRMMPPRTPWLEFPDVVIHAAEKDVKSHPLYLAAKSGDAEAALDLAHEFVSKGAIERLQTIIGARHPILISAHAAEESGVNAIPEALALELGAFLDLAVDGSVVQSNMVAHTGANGFARLARQAAFEGVIADGQDYVLVDDFVGQGGTLANLKGFVERNGGRVIGATVLTGKPFSAKLMLNPEQLSNLRAKHGQDIENWWRGRFGHGFDCLTQSEARYLERSPDAVTIRNRITEAEQTGDRRER